MEVNKGVKNIFYGILAQSITIILGIIIPRLVLVNLGSEANGLLNSVSSVLAYMSLLEAGVGTATLQALYKPVSEKKYRDINRIMAATDRFYRRTGVAYLLLVVVIAGIYALKVSSDIPTYSIFIVVFLTGASGVISYFFQGKYRILLQAEGKSYISTIATTVQTIGTSLTKAFLLVSGFNIVAIQTSYFIYSFLQMVIITFYMRKNYKWLDLSVEPDYEAIGQRKAVLVHQISALIFNNTDVLVLTVFSTLKEVSVYSMYALVFGMVKTITVIFSEAFTYALGQSFNNRKQFLKIFNTYEVYNISITFSLFFITRILILPFFKLYTKGVSDINYLDNNLAELFVIFYLLHNARVSSGKLIEIAQRFEDTKWRSVLESFINVTVSVLMVIKFGIYGVLIGTIAALLYRTNDMIIFAASIINRSPLITYKRWFTNIIIYGCLYMVIAKLDIKSDSYIELIVSGIFVSIIAVPVFLGINSFIEPESRKYAVHIIKKAIFNKER